LNQRNRIPTGPYRVPNIFLKKPALGSRRILAKIETSYQNERIDNLSLLVKFT